MLRIKINKPFNLNASVTCGQAFRFFERDNSFDIILKDRVVNVYMDEGNLYVSSNKEDNLKEVIINYFDLNNDYEKINNIIKEKDAKIRDAVDYSNGLMMLRQAPFETLIAYIISANNGVVQITNALNMIAKRYGKKVLFNNREYYLFPSYQDLKDVSTEDFRYCKVGFRDKYLKKIIEKLNNNDMNLEEYYNMSTEDALKDLMKNDGIGPKVASCILLFAYQKYDVFPVDTWVKKIMKDKYNIEGEQKIRDFAKKTYGMYSGLALQYLFNYSRNKKGV